MQNTKNIEIVVDQNIPFLKEALRDFSNVRLLPAPMIQSESLKNSKALITRTRTKCNAQLLDNSNVEFIASATIGFDHIDTRYCDSHNITWTNAPGCNSGSVAQYVLAALLEFFSEKNLNPENLTLGVVGVGNVGSKVKNIADLLGMRVLLCDPPRQRKENASEFCSIDEIQKEADIITFHVPLNREGVDKTFKMADEAFFDALSKQALIINTSRGEVIDENALLKAMDYEKIAACILDVFENEPEINREILEKAFIATPHIAGYSLDGKVKGTTMSVDALYEYFGLKKDYPEISNLPVPNEEHIEIDVLADFLTTLNEIVKHTYNIMEDDERLRAKPSDFEKLRAEYPLRREFQAYSLTLHDGNDKLQSVVQGLGYKVGK